MDTTDLAEILAYRLREHLGTAIDYRATLRPNEVAIDVEMVQPTYLCGLRFTYREDGELPYPIIVRMAPIAPELAEPTAPTRHWIRTADVPTPVYAYVDATLDAINNITGGTVMNTATATNAIFRTAEQEIRYRDYERRNREHILLPPEQWDEYVRLGGMAACPNYGTATPVHVVPVGPIPTLKPRVRVKVWRDDYSVWQVGVWVGTATRELPPAAVIKSLLPPADKRYLPSKQGRYKRTLTILQAALTAGLPPQSLHDALRAWVVATEGMPTNVESNEPLLDDSTALLLNAQPATLEVGGKVYRLVPTKELDARPLIRRVREKAISLAKVEATAIRGRATTDARVVVNEAEARAANLREEIERERRTLGNRAPEWMVSSGRPHNWDGSYWYVEMRVLCQVKEIRYTVQGWNRVLYWEPINLREASYYASIYNKLPVWVRLRRDGAYTKEDISCRGFVCTHIDSYMCMELQALPPALTSREQLNALEAAISRGMRVVNLNSPLNTQVSRYWPIFLEQIPPIPIKLMTSGNRADRYIYPDGRTMEIWKAANPGIRWDREELIEQEAATIFHVEERANATPR